MDAPKFFQRLFAQGTSSLLQYVRECYPWSASQAVSAKIAALAEAEQAALAKIARYLRTQRLGASPGVYPGSFTTINFCSLDHLLPMLVARQRENLDELEPLLGTLHDEPARRVLAEYLAVKRDTLKKLQSLSTEPAAQIPATTTLPETSAAPVI